MDKENVSAQHRLYCRKSKEKRKSVQNFIVALEFHVITLFSLSLLKCVKTICSGNEVSKSVGFNKHSVYLFIWLNLLF